MACGSGSLAVEARQWRCQWEPLVAWAHVVLRVFVLVVMSVVLAMLSFAMVLVLAAVMVVVPRS